MEKFIFLHVEAKLILAIFTMIVMTVYVNVCMHIKISSCSEVPKLTFVKLGSKSLFFVMLLLTE